jgi:hypothetical protein
MPLFLMDVFWMKVIFTWFRDSRVTFRLYGKIWQVIWEDLEDIFQYEVLKMLKKEGKINDVIIQNMLSWRHSGFHVYIGDRIHSDDKTGV